VQLERKERSAKAEQCLFIDSSLPMAARKLEKNIAELNAIFRNRDDNNFINLSPLRRLIDDKRPTAYLLSGNAKLKDVLVRLQKNDEDPVRDNGLRVILQPELAIELIKVKRPDLSDVVEQWRHVFDNQTN